jgi:5-methylcytosine-specific restriction protein B
LDEIKKNDGNKKEVAVNRILVTLYPKRLLTIPGTDDVKKLAILLQLNDVENKDWIELCFRIRPLLEQKYPNKMHWAAYLQLVQESNLIKNYNLILMGAPGTGKTYLARQMAANIIGCNLEQLNNHLHFGFVQFHPSYDYTDFVEGLRPLQIGRRVMFKRQDGVFKAFCAKAALDTNPNNKYVFVIDEINRGEISKIFGELFFSIDPGYREEKDRIPVRTQYQNLIDSDASLTDENYPFKKGFYVPSNVYVIGTMNDIDRSVESMDFAFRRRFSFYEIKAEDTQYAILKDCNDMLDAINKMNSLNKAIEKIGGLSPAYHIGASYFKKISLYENEREKWNSLWDNHLKGLLFEYLRGLPSKEIEKKLKDLKQTYDTPREDDNA